MRRFQISVDQNVLVLTMSPGLQRVVPGCMMLMFSFACVTMLGVLAILRGDVGGGDDMNFINPRANHFGFLWLVTSLLAAVLTPLYALKVILAPIVFRFDRRTGQFTRNAKLIAPLDRIEGVSIHHADDPDHRSVHKLIVVHSDGFETPLDNWYDEAETNRVASLIADFNNVRVSGLRTDLYEDGGMVPRSEGV